MLNMNIEQQNYITDNSERVQKLASKIWDAVNEVDYDPMHPAFKHFDDKIKDRYISAASYLILANDGFIN